jgi:cytochrome bd-type quinol oxidase subunit 1
MKPYRRFLFVMMTKEVSTNSSCIESRIHSSTPERFSHLMNTANVVSRILIDRFSALKILRYQYSQVYILSEKFSRLYQKKNN